MMINLIKFIHIICALSLIGGTMLCFAYVSKHKAEVTPSTHRIIAYISTLALLTGTLLIYPKHFTFYTPWIQAAYVLITCYAIVIAMLKRYKDYPFLKNHKIILLIYLLLLVVLMLITHDAVTKKTFLIR
jgi:uncharacterized membrane protein SirB2